MDPRLIIVALVAYLLGSIPFGYILVKLFLKQDIRETGSGNIGATNVARSGRKGLAIVTLVLDAAKGAVAVYIAATLLTERGLRAYSLTPGVELNPLVLSSALAALFAILGHCFPVWLGFKGGKGVATAVGAFAMLSPKGVLAALVCFAIVFGATRYVSLGSVVSSLLFPPAVYFLDPEMRFSSVAFITVISSALIILKHHANIQRLIAGTEPKFGAKAISTSDPIQTEKQI